jgi:hypothetical protein
MPDLSSLCFDRGVMALYNKENEGCGMKDAGWIKIAGRRSIRPSFLIFDPSSLILLPSMWYRLENRKGSV